MTSELRAALLHVFEEIVERPLREDDDYFDRGGDSLSTMVIIDRIEHEHGIAVPIFVFYESSRMGDLLDVFIQRIETNEG